MPSQLKETVKKDNLLLKEPITIINITKQIDYILEREKNKELEKIKQDLQNYKIELENKINFKTPIANENFKKVLFSNLEPLVFEAIYNSIPKQRNDKIRQLYRWYSGKLKQFNSLDHISIRTDKKKDEVFLKEELPSDDIIIQDDQYEQIEFKNHRTNIEGFEPPKDRIKEFAIKKINPPQSMKKDSKILADLKFNLERFKGRVGSAKSSITFQSTFYATKTGQKWFSNNGIGVNDNLQPIQPRRELKNSYSYLRPNYEYNKLVIEKQIVKAKNKEVAEKRNQKEIKHHMAEFGRNRAQFKEEREMRYAYTNLINHYDKTFIKTIPTANLPQSITEEIVIDNQFERLDKDIQKEKVLYSRINNNPSLSYHRNKDIKEFKIFTSLSKNDLMKQMVEEQKNKTNNIKADTLTMAMTHDNIFQARRIGGKMCNGNEIQNVNIGYTHHYTPLSAFDALNYANNLNGKNTFPQTQKHRPSTVGQFISEKYDEYKYNLLSLRKTMDKFQQKEIGELEKTLNRAESCSQLEGVKKLFEPINPSQYPSSFLPRTKSTLLHIPPGLLNKKNKKKKKY